MDEIFIQHRFTIYQKDKDNNDRVLNDAIVLPVSEYEKLTDNDIEKTKQQRFDNWITALNTPQPVISDEDQLTSVDEQIESLDQQKEQLLSQKTQLETAISSKVDPVLGGK